MNGHRQPVPTSPVRAITDISLGGHPVKAVFGTPV
jgi:hypothetical protein